MPEPASAIRKLPSGIPQRPDSGCAPDEKSAVDFAEGRMALKTEFKLAAGRSEQLALQAFCTKLVSCVVCWDARGREHASDRAHRPILRFRTLIASR
jgi:hypothetical protein